MAITGEIRNLYSDRERTQVVLPRTKTKAVTDDNSVSLDVLLDGKAPAGNGYDGRTITPLRVAVNNDPNENLFNSEIDNIIATMNNRTIIQFLFENSPLGTVEYFGSLYRHNANYCVITGRSYTGAIVRKVKYAGVWQPWEWENPPMLSGVEYRTTERYNDKAVYTKYVNYGYITAGEHSIAHGIGNIDNIVGLEMINSTYGNFTSYFNASADRTNVSLNTPWNMGGFVYIMKYTKL